MMNDAGIHIAEGENAMDKKKIAKIIASVEGGICLVIALAAVAGEVIGFRYKTVTEIGKDGMSRQVVKKRW